MYKCHLLSEVFSVDVHIFVFLYYKWNLFSYNFRFMSMNLAYIYQISSSPPWRYK